MAALPPLDVDLLRAFVTIADTGSFTRAGERLMRTQSTVSLQLKRLEEVVGQRLFQRTPRAVDLTDEGRTLLPYARKMIDLNDAAVAELKGGHLKGLVRLGTPEDFATTHLPHVLARFADAYPDVALEVTCDLTLNLIDAFRTGAFDLVLIKREPQPADASGVAVWREPLVWAGIAAGPALARADLPLVVAPTPCVYRKRATQALDRAGRAWRIAYTSPSLAGAQAAVRAGLGVTVLPVQMVPGDCAILGPGEGLPPLADAEIALMSAPALTRPAGLLRDHMVRSLGGPMRA
jgi:DNA-binding transcriptional LysR family regulator